MRGVIVNPFLIPGGVQVALKSGFPTAVRQVLGTSPKAAMVFGGSSVLAAVRSAKAVRPLSQFGAFASRRSASRPRG